MEQMVIMAYPATAAKIVVLNLDTNETICHRTCWGFQLVDEVPTMIDDPEQMKSILIIGPTDYTQTILEALQKNIPNIYIELGEM